MSPQLRDGRTDGYVPIYTGQGIYIILMVHVRAAVVVCGWGRGGEGVVKFKTPISVYYERVRRNHIYVLTPRLSAGRRFGGACAPRVRGGQSNASWRHRLRRTR